MNAVAEPRRIVVVEDEPATRAVLSEYLVANGFHVIEAADGTAFRRVLAHDRFDLVLLDVRLPDADGLELARELRRVSDCGLIFVTSMDGEIDRVLGLELGADDYITKPVQLRELLARVRSTLRRVEPAQAPAGAPQVVKLGPWEIDFTRREAILPDASRAPLTRAEFDLLAALVEAEGRPLSREFLLDVVSRQSEQVGDRTVDTLIARLRRKLEIESGSPPLILTERGIGYRAAIRRR